jgi:tetratricopeptide (TPR) repeat protein
VNARCPWTALLILVLSMRLVSAATGGEPVAIEGVDIGPCLAALAADDLEKSAVCAGVIDSDKTSKADRVKILIGRGALFARHDQVDRAIADYTSALQFDASVADIYNERGELWLRKGDRPKAAQDFGAALKLDSHHEKARSNQKALSRELERMGAQLAVAGKPSFNCARARKAVEKVICAKPELADLDREIFASNIRVIGEARNPAEAKVLQREQDQFIAQRNAGYGRPGYDLSTALKTRLQQLNGIDGY